jgi:hypothetical protein
VKRFLLPLIALLFFQTAFCADYSPSPPVRCLENVLQKKTGDAAMTEARLLSLFNPEHVSSKDVFDLTDQSYSMKTADGHQYVVRIPSTANDIHRGKFAAAFVNRTPHGEVPARKRTPLAIISSPPSGIARTKA